MGTLHLLFDLSHVGNLIDGNSTVGDCRTIGICPDKDQHAAQTLAGVGEAGELDTVMQYDLQQMCFMHARQFGMHNCRKSLPCPCPERGVGIRAASDIKPFEVGFAKLFQRSLLTPRPQNLINPLPPGSGELIECLS